MNMSSVQFINTENLKIARENMGLSTIDATKKISKSQKDLIADWENGESLPTWKQVSKLSKIYNIPELVLFSEKQIKKNEQIPDYRIGVDGEDDAQLKKLINLVLSRQSWLEKELKSKSYPKNKVLGSGSNITDPKKLADFIKKTLEIDLKKIKSFYGNDSKTKALSYLIEQTEKKGVFVGKTIAHIKIEVENMRGLFIANEYCPFIVINRKDSQSAQIFSFIHELSHLFRNTNAISNTIDFRNTDMNLNEEEVFCNKVASEFLLPKEDFTKDYYNKEDIERISELYKVSQIFVFYRLKELNKIERYLLRDLENEILREMKSNLIEKNKKKQSGGNYNNNMKDSNGGLFNKFISYLYHQNQIGYVEASNLLKFSVESYE
jgi:Zn-dependent peptidase ImmA (M78 family)/transcriptional regulator with XRE-family HTH domain